jgi:hypothetical protein
MRSHFSSFFTLISWTYIVARLRVLYSHCKYVQGIEDFSIRIGRGPAATLDVFGAELANRRCKVSTGAPCGTTRTP